MSKVKKTSTKKLYYLGAAISQGQKIPDVDKTPDIFRQTKLFEGLKKKFDVEIIDLGNVSASDATNKETNQSNNTHIKNLPLLDSMLEVVNNRIITALNKSDQPLMLTVGGDHSVGVSTLHALQTHYKDLKVIWVDAHPDFLDATMTDYYGYHGYPAGHACGLSQGSIPGFKWLKNLVPFENLVMIAIRDIDPDQWINLKKYNIKCFTMDHVLDLGIGEVVRQAMNYLDPKGDKPFHISFDVDAIDPNQCLATGTKFRGGLRPSEGNYIIRKVAQERKLVGLDVVEINTALEMNDRLTFRSEEHYGVVGQTLGIGIDLIQSAFTEYFTL